MTRREVLLFGAALNLFSVSARTSRNLLAPFVGKPLIPREQWKPYPPASDRAAWNGLAADAKAAVIARGEDALKQPWTVLTAELELEYQRNGNRSHFEAAQFARRYKLRDLVLAECVAADGRFLEEIVNGVWLTCEETFWGLPAHLGAQRAGVGLADASEPIIDLFAAETSSLLAWLDYLLGPRLDSVSKLLRPRIYSEVNRRILAPGLAREDFGWMGLGPRAANARPPNNWNPWINSNWLASSLLLDPDESRRAKTVSKIMTSLDVFLNGYGDDGGCDEGPTYWTRAGASLLDCLELLHSASNGAIDIYSRPLIRNMGAYIYRVHIAGDYYLNFGDAPAKAKLSGALVFRYGQRTGDNDMRAFGSYLARREDNGLDKPESLERGLPALFNLQQLRAQPPSEVLLEDVWLPDLQVMAARSGTEFYVGAKGGTNARSHGHNDVGNFVLFVKGQPVLVDAGVGTYTAKTFSSHRYDIWTMQSAFHNVPTIDGVMQSPTSGSQAADVHYTKTPGGARLSMNIEGAYPKTAGLASWKRNFDFDRQRRSLTLTDSYKLEKPPSQLTMTLMTPCQVDAGTPGRLIFGELLKATLPEHMTAKVETIELDDPRLKGVWGERLFRVVLTDTLRRQEGSWDFLFTPR